MNRYQKILAGLLVLQLALAAIVFWPRQSAQAVGQPLLGELATEEVTAVTITDAEGRTLALVRASDGWVLASGGDYPANTAAVATLLAKVTAARTDRLVTRTEASHNQLQIADDNFVRRIQLTLADGTTRTVYMGTAANFQTTHLRRAGQDNVYLAAGITSQDATATASSWIEASYITLLQEEVTAVKLENSHAVFEFSKDDAGEWKLADVAEAEEYQPGRFDAILSRVANLRMAEPLGIAAETAYGVDNPAATLTITTENEAGTHTSTLLIGARDEASDTYVVKWSDADYFVRVSSFNVQDIVDLKRDELVSVIETTSEDAAGSEEVTPDTDE